MAALTKLRVSSDDSLSRPRVLVARESAPSAPIWIKTREIAGAGQEIVESLTHDGQTVATIHRPTRGWYLAIRRPGYDKLVNIVPSRGRQAIGHFSFALEGPPEPTQDGKEAAEPIKRMYAVLPSTPVKQRFGLIKSLISDNNGSFSILDPDNATPVVHFSDTTSIFGTSSTGTLTIEPNLVRQSGHPIELFIAIALAILESHEDAEAYRAANEDLLE